MLTIIERAKESMKTVYFKVILRIYNIIDNLYGFILGGRLVLNLNNNLPAFCRVESSLLAARTAHGCGLAW